MIKKARVERDNEKLESIVADLIKPPGVAIGSIMAWPCLGNFRVYRGDHRRNFRVYLNHRPWMDDTKPP